LRSRVIESTERQEQKQKQEQAGREADGVCRTKLAIHNHLTVNEVDVHDRMRKMDKMLDTMPRHHRKSSVRKSYVAGVGSTV